MQLTQLNSVQPISAKQVSRVEWSCVGVAIDTSPTQLSSTQRRVELCRYKRALRRLTPPRATFLRGGVTHFELKEESSSCHVSDLQINSQLFSQGVTGLKIRLHATPTPTTNDNDSHFILWLSIVWMYIYCRPNPALRLPYITKPIVLYHDHHDHHDHHHHHHHNLY